MKVWKIAPGRNASNWDRALEHGKIFVGWPHMGDLRDYDTQEQVSEKLKELDGLDTSPINNTFTLWAFSKLVEPGDVVIANRGTKGIVGIGKVVGDYEYKPEEYPEYPHIRKVNWIITDEINLRARTFPNKTLSEIWGGRLDQMISALGKKPNLQEKLEVLFARTESAVHSNVSEEDHFIEEFYKFVKRRRFSFTKEMLARFVCALCAKPFVILSGISGTGKTKIAQLFAEFMSESQRNPASNSNFLQFEYKVQRYNLDYNRMIIPTSWVERLNWQDREQGVTVKLQFDGMEEEAFANWQNHGYALRLGFKKTFKAWFAESFAEGATLYIRVYTDGLIWECSSTPFGDQRSVPKQSAFLSVRPDWLDHRGLLGSYNPITETYQVTEMVKILSRAQRHKDLPFFVVLDEMNLAKVEHYFSDFLSCLESRRLDDEGNLLQEAIVLHQQTNEAAQSIGFTDEDGTFYNIPSSIEIPQNLYIIGTVNVDETTYMFSPKVLDRAHVIECNEVDFAEYRNQGHDVNDQNQGNWTHEDKVTWLTTDASFHTSLYAKSFLDDERHQKFEPLFAIVDELSKLMMEEGYSFGYRVFDEIFAFLIEASHFTQYFKQDEALDIAILQKVLPKLHGNRAQIEVLLIKLFNFCLSPAAASDDGAQTDQNEAAILQNHQDDYSEFRFKRSAPKVHAMYRQLQRSGYCSFIQ